jgi:ElaB/YqjD/DUF883 family membrane-anchored ribosome-binding protein
MTTGKKDLQQEIEQAREQLGETVEQLVAKADVTARAKDKAASLAGRVKDQASQVKAQAAPVWEATPEPARQAVAKGAGVARQHRMPLAVAAAGVLIAGFLVVRWWRKQ